MKKCKSVNSMMKSLDKIIQRERKEHPIKYYSSKIYYKIEHFLTNLKLEIWTIQERARKGWSSPDTWHLDYYLASIIEQTVKHLKKNVNGCPTNLTEGQWVDILNDISYTFYLAKRIADGELHLIKDKNHRDKMQEICNDMNKRYDRNERCMTYKEIQDFEKGWKLFKQYFFNLWD